MPSAAGRKYHASEWIIVASPKQGGVPIALIQGGVCPKKCNLCQHSILNWSALREEPAMWLLKRIVSLLPRFCQTELKRVHFRRQILRNTFESDEPEYELLPDLVSPGGWVIDVGANIGHYTKRLSDLVGPAGRVIAFEPVPETFSLLAANSLLFSVSNVTLINAALSNFSGVVGMSMPTFDTGLANFYQARLTDRFDSAHPYPSSDDLAVMCVSLDALGIERRISLIKIDVEGHEDLVLQGMSAIVSRDHPTLIVEAASKSIQQYLEGLGYMSERLAGSPNVLFRFTTGVSVG
jgi:FkbM family methyltransferase